MSIGYPSGEYATRSYFDFHWTSEDEESDIGMSELKIVDGKTFNVTGSNERSLYLEKGIYDLELEVRNRANLYYREIRTVTLNNTFDVIFISNPEDGEVLNDDPVEIEWTIKSYFPLVNLPIQCQIFSSDEYCFRVFLLISLTTDSPFFFLPIITTLSPRIMVVLRSLMIVRPP